MATSYSSEVNMSKQVQFEGGDYTFPDDATQEEIIGALSEIDFPIKAVEDETTKEDEASYEELFATPSDSGDKQFSDREVVKADNPLQRDNQQNDGTNVKGADKTAASTTPGRVSRSFESESLSKDERVFRDSIVQVETGGVDNAYIRTTVKPKKGEAGSSAYGPAQITRGLLVTYLANRRKLFKPSEIDMLLDLTDRQKVSLIIGGTDRKAYSRGGSNAAYGAFMADAYGYDDVEEFLDDFDYGGTLGLGVDANFKVQYENVARKMLKQTLKDAGGDQLEAASVWHGGTNWRKSKAHRKYTDQYRMKFGKL
jgi:hypothetical protein